MQSIVQRMFLREEQYSSIDYISFTLIQRYYEMREPHIKEMIKGYVDKS